MTRAFPESPYRREIAALARSWRVRAWAALLAAFSIILLTLPLFNVLGFEFAIATTIPMTFAAGHIGVVAVELARRRRVDWPNESAARIAVRRLLATLTVLAALLAIPILAGLVGAAFILNCNLTRGIAIYGILVVPGALLATCLGQILAYAIPRRVWPNVAFVAVALATAIYAVYTFVTEPTVALFHPFVGYYPGSLYDERIETSTTLFVYRGATLLLTLGIALAAIALLDAERLRLRFRVARRRPATAFAALLAIAAYGAIMAYGGRLGFSVTHADIDRVLSLRRSTEHFVIHYAPDSDTARDIDRIAREHEFQFAVIADRLVVAFNGTIHSYFYPNADTKARLMGARNTYIAKPWLREVHLQHEPFPHPILRHELVHVVAGAFAPPPFRLSQRGLLAFNIGLIEGLAVAIDWTTAADEQRLTPHHWAAAIRRLPGLRAPAIADVMGVGGFWAHAASVSYTVAGSFVRFLIERHGIAKVRAVYADGDFARVYGRPLGDLAREWESVVDALALTESDLHAAELRFRRPSIFHRPCPHEVALLRHEASRDESAGRGTCALAHLEAARALEPDEPGHLREKERLLRRLGRVDDADAAIDALLKHPKLSVGLRCELNDEAGDRAWRRGDRTVAAEHYRDVLGRGLSYPSERMQTVRLAAIADPILEPPIRALLLSEGTDATRLDGLRRLADTRRENALAPYLLGRQEWNRGRFAAAVTSLTEALRRGLPTDALRGETERLLGVALFHLGRYDAARVQFAALAAGKLGPGQKEHARDWMARCSFWEATMTRQRATTHGQ